MDMAPLFFGVRRLDAALAVPFFLSARPSAIVQPAKLTEKESGVKPPHSKKGLAAPACFGVRRLDAALAVPFFLSAGVHQRSCSLPS
jgi:hypothetical protein